MRGPLKTRESALGHSGQSDGARPGPSRAQDDIGDIREGATAPKDAVCRRCDRSTERDARLRRNTETHRRRGRTYARHVPCAPRLARSAAQMGASSGLGACARARRPRLRIRKQTSRPTLSAGAVRPLASPRPIHPPSRRARISPDKSLTSPPVPGVPPFLPLPAGCPMRHANLTLERKVRSVVVICA